MIAPAAGWPQPNQHGVYLADVCEDARVGGPGGPRAAVRVVEVSDVAGAVPGATAAPD